MAQLLTIDDLTPFATIGEDKAEAMVADAIAQASLVAECLGDVEDLTPLQISQAKSVLRGAILRWHDAGSGAVSQQTAGPFGVTLDTRQTRRAMFWPSEISALQKICKSGDGGTFSVDTAAEPMRFRGMAYGMGDCPVPLFDSEIAIYGDYTDGSF